MNVLDLAEEMGLNLKRTASTKGGEYHSSCPDSNCGGVNRFCIWPKEGSSGRYWCRRCDRSGDAIEFCREFMGMSFPDACVKVGKSVPMSNREFPIFNQKSFSPIVLTAPSECWRQKALEFVNESHMKLCENPHLINLNRDRGLNLEAIQRCKLGWNDVDSFHPREDWGLPVTINESKLICLPKGIVIPCFRDNTLMRVKIRRNNWAEGDKYPKYQIVSGGVSCPMIYGKVDKPLVLIEAELDAVLVHQLAGDLCSCIALGGVTNKPDKGLHEAIKKANIVLYALDYDEAGKKHFQFWKSNYNNLKAWPVPKGKSPGDAFIMGVNIREWVIAGLKRYTKFNLNSGEV